MAKDREIACEFYDHEGVCLKNHEGTFRSHCQVCKDYRAKRGGIPFRKDLRREKKDKQEEKESRILSFSENF